jgi:hypothetical protein
MLNGSFYCCIFYTSNLSLLFSDRILIHYPGWSKSFDEWRSIKSNMIREKPSGEKNKENENSPKQKQVCHHCFYVFIIRSVEG